VVVLQYSSKSLMRPVMKCASLVAMQYCRTPLDYALESGNAELLLWFLEKHGHDTIAFRSSLVSSHCYGWFLIEGGHPWRIFVLVIR
jgi:hypothetical protein